MTSKARRLGGTGQKGQIVPRTEALDVLERSRQRARTLAAPEVSAAYAASYGPVEVYSAAPAAAAAAGSATFAPSSSGLRQALLGSAATVTFLLALQRSAEAGCTVLNPNRVVCSGVIPGDRIDYTSTEYNFLDVSDLIEDLQPPPGYDGIHFENTSGQVVRATVDIDGQSIITTGDDAGGIEVLSTVYATGEYTSPGVRSGDVTLVTDADVVTSGYNANGAQVQSIAETYAFNNNGAGLINSAVAGRARSGDVTLTNTGDIVADDALVAEMRRRLSTATSPVRASRARDRLRAVPPKLLFE